MSARTEAALLGGLLIDPEAVDAVAGIVAPDDFHSERAREAFAAMLALRSRGLAVDIVTVSHELEARGVAGRVGIAELAEAVNLCPTSLHVGTYARQVAEDGARRRTRTTPPAGSGDTGIVI